jgi:hypothetical protein
MGSSREGVKRPRSAAPATKRFDWKNGSANPGETFARWSLFSIRPWAGPELRPERKIARPRKSLMRDIRKELGRGEENRA